MTDLNAEAERASGLLLGKVVARVTRHRAQEVCVEFEDGTRLYVDGGAAGVELSVVGGRAESPPPAGGAGGDVSESREEGDR